MQSKVEIFEMAIKQFNDSDRTVTDYMDFLGKFSRIIAQGSGLTWPTVEEILVSVLTPPQTDIKYDLNVHCDIEFVNAPDKVELILEPDEINKILNVIQEFEMDVNLETVELNLGSIEHYDLDFQGKRVDFDGGSEVGSSYDPDWRIEGERVKINRYGVSVIGYDKYNGFLYWSDDISITAFKEANS